MFFKMFLKNPLCQIEGKSGMCFLFCKCRRKRPVAYNYHSISLDFVASIIFMKLVYYKIVDQLEPCGYFCYFLCDFKSS